MISITAKSKYALRALLELAAHGGDHPVAINELATARQIPLQFLEQVFASLRRAGLLQSVRGARGGYRFARSPAEITVLDIVEALDGPLNPLACTSDRGCERADQCGAGSVWWEAKLVLERTLRSLTLADVAAREATLGPRAVAAL
jgi:Rrf2 family protein